MNKDTARTVVDTLECYVQLNVGSFGRGRPSRGARGRKRVTLHRVGRVTWASAETLRWRNKSGDDEIVTHWSLWDAKRGGRWLGNGTFREDDIYREWLDKSTPFTFRGIYAELPPLFVRLLPA